jgi:hypothetical protein
MGWVVSVDHSDLKQVLAEWAVREKNRLFKLETGEWE